MKKECSFKILGNTWKVIRSDKMDINLGGNCDPGNRIITVRSEYKYERFVVVVSHELAHAIAFELGLVYECEYPVNLYKVIMDHTQIDSFSSIYTVLLDIVKQMR